MERNEAREGTIAVAIDNDKTSCQALKWAVDHYIPRDGTVKLVHVVQRSSLNANGSHTDDELSDQRQHNGKRSSRFLALRCLCMRRNIQSEVVLLEDQDVAKALIEYISQNCISTFLLGASLKNSITRLFKADDIPSNVMRWAPDFCTVYVISKGRLSNVRSASRPLPQALPSPSSGTAPVLSPHSNTDEAPSEMSLSREDDVFFEEFSSSLDRDSSVNSSRRISTDSSVLSFYEKLATPHMLEIPRLSLSALYDEKSNFSIHSPSNENYGTLISPLSPTNDAEAEMRRLKKELKETMNMYHAACKEALVEKERAAELEMWKKKAELRLQLAEEKATVAIMEMEKTKLEVQEAETKAVRGRGVDDRDMVFDALRESHILVKHESLLHILVVLFLFYVYFTLKRFSFL
ncbi:PREDICTED: U-box domain-containing protein 51-like [Camelina sativa]|uniref:RING-type E3 ubiquitin transferase n=1 Tax=Camelina sativa TaxID=90675 RepID=A0ABM0Y4H1_CAMSA|nr:PREDICTED: U-box domain-containing protein 51-like [Camelina sativa]